MKLYYLNPNDYGKQWFVMAENKEMAIEAFLKFAKEKDKEAGDLQKEAGMFEEWNYNMNSLNKALDDIKQNGTYTLNCFDVGEVIRSELS